MRRERNKQAKVNMLYESERLKQTYARYVAGVDEAGRGPMAGPVVAAAVILPLEPKIPSLNDSKKLSPKSRERLLNLICETSISFGIGIRSSQYIDRFGIGPATFSPMRLALKMLVLKGYTPELVIVDGYPIPNLELEQEALIRGDNQVASVASASIIAKVTRDRIMEQFDKLYPGYGFSHHKGYCTRHHMTCLEKKGPCPIHRRSFSPVRSLIKESIVKSLWE